MDGNSLGGDGDKSGLYENASGQLSEQVRPKACRLHLAGLLTSGLRHATSLTITSEGTKGPCISTFTDAVSFPNQLLDSWANLSLPMIEEECVTEASPGVKLCYSLQPWSDPRDAP